jgi:hypothetical protein
MRNDRTARNINESATSTVSGPRTTPRGGRNRLPRAEDERSAGEWCTEGNTPVGALASNER